MRNMAMFSENLVYRFHRDVASYFYNFDGYAVIINDIVYIYNKGGVLKSIPIEDFHEDKIHLARNLYERFQVSYKGKIYFDSTMIIMLDSETFSTRTISLFKEIEALGSSNERLLSTLESYLIYVKGGNKHYDYKIFPLYALFFKIIYGIEFPDNIKGYHYQDFYDLLYNYNIPLDLFLVDRLDVNIGVDKKVNISISNDNMESYFELDKTGDIQYATIVDGYIGLSKSNINGCQNRNLILMFYEAIMEGNKKYGKV